jgi:hypothetical protein
MEAERPMQNDERDNRDLPPDAPSDQPQTDEADEADEFETPSWPSQDAAADAPPAAREAEPAEMEQSAEEEQQQVEGPQPGLPDDTGAEPGPPPPEAEAYGAAAATGTPGVAAHSVPATEPGESTQCPRCGTENRPGIAFCSNCGQRLVAAGAPTSVARPAAPEGTQACPRCGTHNRAGVPFCQNCGANLRPAEPVSAPGYVPPEVPAGAAASVGEEPAGHAVLGPIVLLVGAVGIATAWLLPFATSTVSLFDRAFGDPTGYGVAFWKAYPGISGLSSQAYFGFAAPAPILVLLLVALAVGGMVRARAGALQMIGLALALVWAVGLLALFVVVEVLNGPGTDILGVLAALSPAGIILALASLIVMIGATTRFGRG